MWCGSSTDIWVQQEIDRNREWIDSHAYVVAHGRTVLVFRTHERPMEELRSFIERFRRVFFYLRPDQVTRCVDETSIPGANVLRTITFQGTRAHLDRCRELSLPIGVEVRGICLLVVNESSPDDLIQKIQEFYRSVGLIPQPAVFIRGYYGTAVTVVAIEKDGRVIGTSSVQHLRRAGPEFSSIGYSSNTGVLPGYRIAGLGRSINSTVIVEAARRFGIEEIWANTALENEPAIAYHAAVHRTIHASVANFWVELPL